MKTLKLVLGIALFSLVLWSCKNEPETKTVEVEETKVVNEIDANATIAKAEFKIDGMTCAIGCAKTIEKKLSKMEGVKSATVDFEKEIDEFTQKVIPGFTFGILYREFLFSFPKP